MPKYNQLVIENIQYRKPDNSIDTAVGIYLWLAIETTCQGTYAIEEEKYKNKWQTRFEYFTCNDTLDKIKYYSKKGTYIGWTKFTYTPDTVTETKIYRKDGSLLTYDRAKNGKDDGQYFIYYPDGSIKLEAESIQGMRVHEKIYDKNKTLRRESRCDPSGSGCTVKIFDKKGQLKKEKPFQYKGITSKREF